MTSDETIEQLRGNGYLASFANVEGVAHAQIEGAVHDYLISDFAAGTRQYMRDPTASVCVLEFSIEEPSEISTRFIAELLKAVAPADRLLRKHQRPLVRTSATTLHAVYRTDHAQVGLFDPEYAHDQRLLYPLGVRYTDGAKYSPAARLSAHCGSAPVEAGTWLNDRTPLTVKRETLPTWDGDALSAKVHALVGKFIAAGDMRICEPYSPPARDYSHEADLARQGVNLAAPADDAPPPMQYADPRLSRAFGVDITQRRGFWLDGSDEGGERGLTGIGRSHG